MCATQQLQLKPTFVSSILFASAISMQSCKKKENPSVLHAKKSFSARATEEILYGQKVFDLLNGSRNISFDLRFVGNYEGTVPPEKRPYRGYWYPEKLNGTAAVLRDGKSPLQKYDSAFNDAKPLAQDWETQNHGTSQGGEIPAWFGHCNGYSAAAQRHAEPERDVAIGNTIFRPQDIKALLAETYMGAKYLYLGGNRCFSDTTISDRKNFRNDLEFMGGCEDLNPAQLHVSAYNWITKAGYPLIFDIHRTSEVWNYPLYAYRFRTSEITKSVAIELLGSGGADYAFNSRAVSFQKVEATFWYTDAFNDTEHLAHTSEASITLNYILELDSNNLVIGGEWIGSSLNDHPDFLWIAFEAIEGSGHRSFANPHVKPEKVIDLWRKSLSDETLKKQLTFDEPSSLKTWGKFPLYDVAIDGQDQPVIRRTDQHILKIKFSGNQSFFKSTGKVVVSDRYDKEIISGAAQSGAMEYELKIPLEYGRESLRITLINENPKQIDTQIIGVIEIP